METTVTLPNGHPGIEMLPVPEHILDQVAKDMFDHLRYNQRHGAIAHFRRVNHEDGFAVYRNPGGGPANRGFTAVRLTDDQFTLAWERMIRMEKEEFGENYHYELARREEESDIRDALCSLDDGAVWVDYEGPAFAEVRRMNLQFAARRLGFTIDTTIDAERGLAITAVHRA